MMRLGFALVAVGGLLAAVVSAGDASAADKTASIDRWSPFIDVASARFGIPVSWIRAVIRMESGGQTMLAGRPVTSRAGAMGLMQLMPQTWTELRDRFGLGADPYDPHDNILAGTAYLRILYQRYGYPALFAAYNAGPVRFDEYVFDGRPLPAETLAYLAALKQSALEPVRTLAVPSGSKLFFSLRIAPERPPDSRPLLSYGALFVSLSGAREQRP